MAYTVWKLFKNWSNPLSHLFNCFCFSPTDDNSNQSSIADSSPLKQENSNNTSPAPEPMAASQSDSNDLKSDQYPSKQPSSGQDHKSG